MEPEANTTNTVPETIFKDTAEKTTPMSGVPTNSTTGTPPMSDVPTNSTAGTPTGKRRNTPVRPSRAPEECYQDTPKKMTDKEKDSVILFFQKNMESLYAQFDAYKQNTEGAFEQTRQLRIENENLKRESKAKLTLMKQNISMLYQNSILVNMED